MSAYTSIDHLKLGRGMLAEEIDAIEQKYPGTVGSVIEDVSAEFDSALTKRYPVPYAAFPASPRVLSSRVAAVVIQRLWNTYGSSPSNSEKSTRIDALAADALAWLEKAANAVDGLAELPLADTSGGTAEADGITKGGPFGYSEPDPYTWTDVQADATDWSRDQ